MVHLHAVHSLFLILCRLSCGGEVADRDIVQFVPYSKYQVSGVRIIISTPIFRLLKYFLIDIAPIKTAYISCFYFMSRTALAPMPLRPWAKSLF